MSGTDFEGRRAIQYGTSGNQGLLLGVFFPNMMLFVFSLLFPIVLISSIVEGDIQNDSLTSYSLDKISILIALFPIGLVVCSFFISARISAQWEKRYRSELFEDIPKRKRDTYYKIIILPSCIGCMFLIDLSVNLNWIFFAVTFAIALTKIYSDLHPTTPHPQDIEDSNMIFMMVCWGIAGICALCIPIMDLYYSVQVIWFLAVVGLLVLGIRFGDYHNPQVQKLKKLKSAIESGEDTSSMFSSIQRDFIEPTTPLFWPNGLNFLTNTNSHYPWENQTNPEQIIGLMISHKNRVFVTDIAIIAGIILYPPTLLWALCLYVIQPSYIQRPMSSKFRLDYNQLIERCEEFFTIEYGDGPEYWIKSIKAKFSDNILYNWQTNSSNLFTE